MLLLLERPWNHRLAMVRPLLPGLLSPGKLCEGSDRCWDSVDNLPRLGGERGNTEDKDNRFVWHCDLRYKLLFKETFL